MIHATSRSLRPLAMFELTTHMVESSLGVPHGPPLGMSDPSLALSHADSCPSGDSPGGIVILIVDTSVQPVSLVEVSTIEIPSEPIRWKDILTNSKQGTLPSSPLGD